MYPLDDTLMTDFIKIHKYYSSVIGITHFNTNNLTIITLDAY